MKTFRAARRVSITVAVLAAVIGGAAVGPTPSKEGSDVQAICQLMGSTWVCN